MKAAKSRRRKLLVAIGIVSALLALATLPIWFRWVLRPALKHYGVQFDTYRAIGYTRFALAGVHGDYEDVRFEIAGLEAPSLTRWIWARYIRRGAEQPTVACGGWRLIVKTNEAAHSPQPSGSTFEVLQEIEAIASGLRQWLPAARLSNGVVEVGAGKIILPSVDWKRGRLAATLRPPVLKEPIDLLADFSTAASHVISARAEQSALSVELQLKRAAESWNAEGQTLWRSNRVEMTARFTEQDWWPQRARVTADSIRVPGNLLGVEDYEDLNGSFSFDWNEGRFHLRASGEAKPKPGAPGEFPPVTVMLLARGDKASAVVETFKLSAPWIEADLSDSVGIARSGKLLTDAASLNLSLDLAKLPWASMDGKLQGIVRIRPGRTNHVQASFELSGAGLTHAGLDIRQANLFGELDWPILQLHRAEVRFAEASTFAGSAQVDLKTRSVIDGQWRFQGRLPRAWQPDGFSYSNLQTTGQFRGPLSRPTHSGQLAVEGVSMPRSNFCNVRASWRGEKFNLSEAEAQFSAGASTLLLSGALRVADAKDQPSTFALQKLTFQRSTQTVYALQQPCEIAFRPTAETNLEWQMKVAPLRLAGTQREMKLAGEADWPRRGHLTIQWQGVALDDFADFVHLPARNCSVSNLDFTARWDNGPVDFVASAQVNLSARAQKPFSARASLRGSAAGLKVDELIISDSSGAVVSVQGTVPVALVPGGSNSWLRFDEGKAIDLRATTATNKSFWEGLADLTGVRLSNPELHLAIRGTLAQPEGQLRMQAERLGWKSATNPVALPTMENLKAEADFKRDRVHLKTFTIELDGQPVRASGELPLGKSFWTDLVARGDLPDWKGASGRIEIVDARCAIFAKYLPDLLSPQGRLSLELGIQPGAKLIGELQITNAATRPLMPLGHIHDIHAQIKFADRGASIERFSGQIGGQSVSMVGRVGLSEKSGLQFEVALSGTNVPLVREPGVLLRSDLDIRLSQKSGQTATVSGEVILRDSLFLQDLKSLVAGGPTQQSQRPPYFSVDEKPFADWTLNLRINGEKFLRVRTPLFRGEISAHFQLTGSMKEPVALGEARVASGRVQFPFGTLTVDQGYATLTSENPYRPGLFVTASGRAYGYSLKIEVSGPADDPRVAFHSTPPLTSEQIVLMLTAGELPHEGVAFSRQQRATRLAMFVGRDFLNRLMGNETAAERLTVRSGEDFSEEGKQTYYLEYRLTDRWSVVGEYDRFNALNAGLKWKIFSK
jgi:translocation and assembly module TamB